MTATATTPTPADHDHEDYLRSLQADPRGANTAPATTSWARVDLTDAMSDDYRPPQPLVGWRTDGRAVLYPGRTHTLAGESEGGKSWLAQLFAVQELNDGNGVVYLDFEDDGASVANRLLLLGTNRAAILARFAYLSPTEPITTPGSAAQLLDTVRDLTATYVVLDGVTEALAVHGLDPNAADDIARFGRLVTRPLTALGAAVLSLDHVVKNGENRGRYATGSVHKLNAVTGAALTLENVNRFGQGLAGRSRLLIAKDRPGQLRRNALPGTNDRWWYGDLTLDTSQPLPDPAELRAPIEHTTPFRPTTLMTRISDALAGAPEPLTGRGIDDRVKGKAADIRTALAQLIDEGHVATAVGTRGARLHTLIRPFPGDPT